MPVAEGSPLTQRLLEELDAQRLRDERVGRRGANGALEDGFPPDAGDVLGASALGSVIPWARFLPDLDRTEFLSELAECAEACAAVGVWAPETLSPLRRVRRAGRS